MIIAAATDYRAAAQRRLPPFLFHYLDGGAYAEHTLNATSPTWPRSPCASAYSGTCPN